LSIKKITCIEFSQVFFFCCERVLSSSVPVFLKEDGMDCNVNLHFSDIKAKHLNVLSLLKVMEPKVLDSCLKISVI